MPLDSTFKPASFPLNFYAKTLLIINPNPTPWVFRFLLSSNFPNGLNSFCISSGKIPKPVSSTAISIKRG